jgi:DNA-binding PucR family transcriptional regulator
MVAERGLPLGDLLRSFRLGHACFGQILTDAIMALEQDPAELVNAVRESERFSFAVVDVVSSGIGAVYVEQCQRLNGRTASQRRDVVSALLQNDNIDIARAEQSLGHRLTGPQLAFICWSDVLLAIDDFALAGWLDMSRGELQVDKLAAAAGAAAPAAHVALGPVLPGLSGFRSSRAGAERVRRVVGLSRRPAPTLTEWTDVALVDALSADLDAARALVRHELGSLTRPGDDFEMLRYTAQAFVESGYSYAAVASSQHIHRNTALQRVKRAQELRGRPLTERPAALLAALVLMDELGSALIDR